MAEPKKEKRDPFDGDYVGNIWGWRFSIIGAIGLLLLTSLAAYRHYTLGVPIGFDDPAKEAVPAVDTTATLPNQ